MNFGEPLAVDDFLDGAAPGWQALGRRSVMRHGG
jgi:hypothetical protein